MRPAAAVIIGGIGAHGPARHSIFAVGYAGGHAFLMESAVAQIAIELVGLGIVGHEEVGPAIAIEIEHGHAEGLAGGIAEPGALAGFLEASATEVVVQPGTRALVGFRRAIGFGGAVERAPQIVLGP